MEKYSIILTSLEKKNPSEKQCHSQLSSLWTDYNSAHCLATRHSSARDTSCGQFTGKKRVPRWKKKRRGWGEKKIGVRQSMGGRVKRPLTIPFPHAINRTIAANAVNRSNRMFQLGDPALKFLRVSSKPISLSTCPRFSIILLHFSESFHFHNRSMTSSIPKNHLWSYEIFGTKSMLHFLYTSSLW